MDRCERIGETMGTKQVKEFTGVTQTRPTIRWHGDGDIADRAYIATWLGEDDSLVHPDPLKDGFYYMVDQKVAQEDDNKMIRCWRENRGPATLWLFWHRANTKPVRFLSLIHI